MATLKPRITISLEQDVYDTLKGLSKAQGTTMAGLVSDLLTMVHPVQQRVLQAVKKAQALEVDSKADMVANLEAGEAQFTKMLGPLMDLLDQMADGQPPHSNTGVTNQNDTTQDANKTQAKARPRASEPVEKATKAQKHKNTKKQVPQGSSDAA
jgi:hypothetical protein